MTLALVDEDDKEFFAQVPAFFLNDMLRGSVLLRDHGPLYIHAVCCASSPQMRPCYKIPPVHWFWGRRLHYVTMGMCAPKPHLRPKQPSASNMTYWRRRLFRVTGAILIKSRYRASIRAVGLTPTLVVWLLRLLWHSCPHTPKIAGSILCIIPAAAVV